MGDNNKPQLELVLLGVELLEILSEIAMDSLESVNLDLVDR